MSGVNTTEAKKLEDFIKRHASIGAVVTVFLHNDPSPVGTIKKSGQLFVPPGVVRESKFQPLIPNSYYFTTTQEELKWMELEGFDKVIRELKKRVKGVVEVDTM